jgi:lipopolysaccharide transport system ATP-binding protein
MAVAIKAEGLSKIYQIGQIGTGTITRDIERWAARIRGKDDPYLKIGEVNERGRTGTSDWVWSLKDISFEIGQGDTVGIIGRNGAGKSTLLKILSRVTSPTSGTVRARGRIASLLEVGTGFHPELTGRENIFLNGAILGMRKKEISRKLDEIIDFSGVERYIDTPVKRYSSGMYVRLAFAVAAHLDAEILIVDEVLAVGDAEFQKKCLGKMKDVSRLDGRTVLFVSHSINAIKRLCTTGILLKLGQIACQGKVDEVIGHYEKMNKSTGAEFNHIAGTRDLLIHEVLLLSHPESTVRVNDEVLFEIRYSISGLSNITAAEFFAIVYNNTGEAVIGCFGDDTGQRMAAEDLGGKILLKLSANLLPGDYILSVGIFDQNRNFIDWVDEALCFTAESFYSDGRPFYPRLGQTVGNARWMLPE